jgi:anti-sigma-K factor RskA
MTDETGSPDMLAAEYVLGTLADDERRRADALRASDPRFERLVRYWEHRLGQLHAMVQPIEPPPEIWARVQARVAGAEPGLTMLLPDAERAAHADRNVIDLHRRLGHWRKAAAGLGALAAGLVAIIVTAAINPDLLPVRLRPKPVEIVRTVEAPAGRLVAVLQQNAASPAFILTVDVASRTASVRRVSAEQQPGKSYELWLVSDRFPGPRSLGLVGTDEFARPTLANYDPAIISDATYAVSLEPEGGSPTGAPTGPVLFAGKLVEAVPPGP